MRRAKKLAAPRKTYKGTSEEIFTPSDDTAYTTITTNHGASLALAKNPSQDQWNPVQNCAAQITWRTQATALWKRKCAREIRFLTFSTEGVAEVIINIELTQQEGRKTKKTSKRLCETKGTRLLLDCFVVSSPNIGFFLVFCEEICLKEGEVWRKIFPNEIVFMLVTQGLSSSFSSRPDAFTNKHVTEWSWVCSEEGFYTLLDQHAYLERANLLSSMGVKFPSSWETLFR